MKVHVSKGHIARGKRRVCAECPVALALIDAMNIPAGTFVEVGHRWLTVGKEQWPTPPSVKSFITRFDRYGVDGVYPFEFELDIPAGSVT